MTEINKQQRDVSKKKKYLHLNRNSSSKPNHFKSTLSTLCNKAVNFHIFRNDRSDICISPAPWCL